MYGPDTLLLASKKPHIIELVKMVDTLSIDEIKSLHEKSDTIKGLLYIKEFGKNGPKLTIPEKIANLMERSRNNSQGPLIMNGNIYQIAAEGTWVSINSTHLEVKKGWYWIWLENKQILISNNYIAATQQILDMLIQSSKFIKTSDTIEFKQLEDARRNSLI
jgi:hypothetical protein